MLAGFSIDTYKPRLVCVSAGRSAMSTRIREYFANNDYELITRYRKYDHLNLYFRPRG